MKNLKKLLAVFISLAGALALLVGLGVVEAKREIAAQRRQAERAVTKTVENIAHLKPWGLSVEAITNAAVAPATVTVKNTNPVKFRVEAHTDWPDWMIYDYDSTTPERGVSHYLF
jgi:hypothetical protein